jgi:hypothetical protein
LAPGHITAELHLKNEVKGHFKKFLSQSRQLDNTLLNYEKAVRQEHKFSCLSLAHLLEAHPELFPSSQAELHQRIAQLREQGKASYEAWSKARSI